MVGTPVAKPTPVFTKLDPSVVDEELARLGLGVTAAGDLTAAGSSMHAMYLPAFFVKQKLDDDGRTATRSTRRAPDGSSGG